MCGPKFCSMKITQDIRDYADKQREISTPEVEQGLQEKATEFRDGGSNLYVNVTED